MENMYKIILDEIKKSLDERQLNEALEIVNAIEASIKLAFKVKNMPIKQTAIKPETDIVTEARHIRANVDSRTFYPK